MRNPIKALLNDPVNGFLAIGSLLVIGFLVLMLMGDESEKVYTRISVVWYERQRMAAVKGDMQEAARSLKSVVEYQSPKVPAEGQLGRALELVRQGAIREIIARMRTLSGEDLGDEPEQWIKKYYRKGDSPPNLPAAGNAGITPLPEIGVMDSGVPGPGRPALHRVQ